MNRTITTSFALMILAASGLAHAEPEKTETTEKDVLKGPKVVTTDTSTSTNQDSMTSDDKQNDDQMDPEVELKKNPVLYREYIVALRNPSKGVSDLEITDQQQEQIATIMKDQRQAMADFQEANRDQIREMRDRMQAAQSRAREASEKKSANDKSGDKSNDNNARDEKESKPDAAEQAREKLRTFIDNAAPNKEAISKLKQVLNEEQMDSLNARVLATRARIKENTNRPSRARQGAEDGSDNARPARQRMNPDNAESTGNKESGNRKGARKDRSNPEDD